MFDLSEKRFSKHDAWTAVGFPFFKRPRTPRFEEVLSACLSDSWVNILKRILDGDVADIYLFVEKLPAPSGRLIVDTYAPRVGSWDLTESFEMAFADGGAGEIVYDSSVVSEIDSDDGFLVKPYKFDIGHAVIRAVNVLKEIDAKRGGKPASDAVYSLGRISVMAAERRLANQWPDGFAVRQPVMREADAN
jgi:hypothetical protein